MPIQSWSGKSQSGVLAYFRPKKAILAIFFEIWTSNLFCTSFKLILSQLIEVNWTQVDYFKFILKTTKMAISQNVSITKIPTPPTFFNESVWNFQNRHKYGFCK